MENDCLYSDIILPINTVAEEDDIATGSHGLSYLYVAPRAIDSIGESMSDYEAVGEVAKKLGVYEEYTEGKTVWDWIKYGYEKSGVQDKISWEELNEKQYFCVEVPPDWKEDPAGMIKFYEDPEANPIKTKSGKIEFYAQWMAENFPDDKERPPSPQWIVGGPGWFHDESLHGERCKKYPLLCESNHPRWRLHAECHDITWLREIPTCKVKGPDGYMYEPLWLNPKTAAERGIQSGDIVKMYNERGAVLGGAYVTERVMPGVAYQDHGAMIDEIIPGELDRGGNNNAITPTNITSPNATGMVVSGFLVEVEKVTGDQMEEWRKTYPEAFARDYDPAYGPLFSGWVEGGM